MTAALVAVRDRRHWIGMRIQYDGYPEGTGLALLRLAPTQALATRLVRGGDASGIMVNDLDAVLHYAKRSHWDKGAKDNIVERRLYIDLEDVRNQLGISINYTYVFENGQWYYAAFPTGFFQRLAPYLEAVEWLRDNGKNDENR